MKHTILEKFIFAREKKQKKFAVLIDPDKVTRRSLKQTIDLSAQAQVDYFFVGGSLLVNDTLDECIAEIKKSCSIPVILFPGSPSQINSRADAIFFLSLISGRNPDLLIGQQVIAAPVLKASGLEVISTGYVLIDGGRSTTVSYISNTTPIPAHKEDIAMCTAMAGELLGMKVIYMDAGSGAASHIPENMVKQVSRHIHIPLIVGGGITSPESAGKISLAGADIIVVGNAIEKDPGLISSIAMAIHSPQTV
jgi:putative glycerol-1-phosphate prenyltransferase